MAEIHDTFAVQVVEPNPHFVPFFERNRAQFPQLDIRPLAQGVGEDLAAAGVLDSSVDVVVMTLVLCTVDDQAKSVPSCTPATSMPPRTLAEVRRVLKPGGKMIYMEHIIAGEGRVLRAVQHLLMLGGTIRQQCSLDEGWYNQIICTI
jgi:SAM-dependent methyltransferase